MDYGTTLLLSGGDLVQSTPANCTQMVTGIAKARQDLIVIVQTVKKSFPFDETFGISWPTLIELQNTSAIEWAVKSAVEKYQYTKQVLSITATRITGTRAVNISGSVLLVGGEEVDFEAIL